MFGYESVDSPRLQTEHTVFFSPCLQVKATLLKERADDPGQSAEDADTSKLKASAVGPYASIQTVLFAHLLPLTSFSAHMPACLVLAY